MFAQPFDHSFNDIFNQYVDMDTSNADSNKDVSFPGDLDHIFSLDSLSSDCGDHSPTLSASKPPNLSPQQTWSNDFWSLSQEDVSSTGQDPLAFQESVHLSSAPDLNANFEAPLPAEAHSTPSTPPQTPYRKNKSALVTPKSIQRHQKPNGRGVSRKQSFSPSLTRSSQLQKGKVAYPEAWAQRFQNFSLRGSGDRLPLTPPPSDILVQHDNISADNTAQMNHSGDSAEMPDHFDSGIFNTSPAISMPSPSAGALARQQQRYLSQSQNSTLTSSPPSADDIFSSPQNSNPQSMSSWHSDSLGTSGLSYTPELHGHDAQAWWSPMTNGVAQRQQSYQQMVASPTPQRPIQNSNNQHDMLQGGLMIQLDPSSFDMSTATNSFSPTTMSTGQGSPSFDHTATQHKFVDSSFTTPQIANPPRSPSISPKSGISPKNGAKTSPRRGQAHGRKLSGNSMSAPRPVTKTSPKGGNKSANVSFVNFTPSDSRKILGGVAPSGSSKTKARREQEARDRRRKLSEAALKAVRSAGGDVDALEAVLC